MFDQKMHPLLTLPASLCIKRNESSTGGEYTICSLERFPALTTFGPFIRSSERQKSEDFLPQVETEPECIHLDRLDGMESNWLQYVKNASKEEEANLAAVRTRSGLYYVTCKVIPANKELLVWFPVVFPPEEEGYPTTVLENFEVNTLNYSLSRVGRENSPNTECKPYSENNIQRNRNNEENKMKKAHQQHSSARNHNTASGEQNLNYNCIMNMKVAIKTRVHRNTQHLWSAKEVHARAIARKKEKEGSKDGQQREERMTESHTGIDGYNFSKSENMFPETVQRQKGIHSGDAMYRYGDSSKRFNCNGNVNEDNTTKTGEKHCEWSTYTSKHIVSSSLKEQKIMHLEDYKTNISMEGNDLCDNVATYERIQTGEDCKIRGELPTAERHEFETCREKIRQMPNLLMHNMRNIGEKPYKCNICQQEFIHKRALLLHTGEKPYECKNCSKKFSHLASLKTHNMIHTGERPYKCNLCQKAFIEKKALKVHERVHTGEKPYECKSCRRKFTYRQTFKAHNMLHTGERPYECNICQKTFIQKNILKLHERIHTGEKPYECKTCKRKFSRKYHLQRHILIHSGDRPYECNICRKSFRQKDKWTLHERMHTGEQPYECKNCNRNFSQMGYPITMLGDFEVNTLKDSLTRAGRENSPNAECSPNSENSIQSNRNNEENKMKAQQQHSSARNHNTGLGERNLNYNFIRNKEIATKSRVRRNTKNLWSAKGVHASTIARKKEKEGSQDRQQREKRMTESNTRIDRYNFSTSGNMFPKTVPRHKSVHSGDASYRYDDSLKGFNCNGNLNEDNTTKTGEKHCKWNMYTSKHIITSSSKKQKIMHLEEDYKSSISIDGNDLCNNVTKYERIQAGENCKIRGELPTAGPHEFQTCREKFRQMPNLLMDNMRNIGEKPYKCKVCQQEFIHKRALLLHTGEKTYQCKICSKKFSQLASLKTHTMIHTGERPYKCNLCQKAFIRKKALMVHERVHTGEKPYACKLCRRKFTYRHTFKAHNMVHTGERPYECNVCQKTFIQKHTLKLHERIHSGEKPYECKKCNRKFSRKYHLQRHIVVHSGERPYECNVCRKSFRQKDKLTLHERVHNGEEGYELQ